VTVPAEVRAPENEQRETIAALGRRLARDGLVAGTAGNLSARMGEVMAITPSGVPCAGLRPEDVCLVRITDSRHLPGAGRPGLRPSSETPLHRAVYLASDAAAIVHTHSPFVVAASAVLSELPAVHYAMASLGGSVRVAPYARFGTQALADGVTAALAGRNAVILANHGSLAHGASLEQAYERALTLEWLAQVYWRARLIGEPRVLTAGELAEVSEAMAAMHYGEVPPAT
jgi:L-fuculose-phosphate aldolase